MQVGDLVKHNDGTIGIVLEVKEAEDSIFAELRDRLLARVLWSDDVSLGGHTDCDHRWYGIEIQVINESR